MGCSILDINDELLLVPYKEGVTLLNPNAGNFNCLKKIFLFPINVYFTKCDSVIQCINDTTAITCGYTSEKDAIGRTVESVAKKDAATISLQHDLTVLKEEKMSVIDELFVRKLDEITFPALSFKFPWYGRDNKICGIFGISIVMGSAPMAPLADSLSLLMQTGLLANRSNKISSILPGQSFYGIYLSKRESESLKLLIRGNTAKKIAKILNISPRTAEYYIANIKNKLGVSTSAELIDKAISYIGIT